MPRFPGLFVSGIVDVLDGDLARGILSLKLEDTCPYTKHRGN
jgi:sporulation-control protein spo0M